MSNYVTGDFITQEGLTTIKNHKYKSGGYSIIDNLINPFWEFVVKLMPETLAPNAITLIGVVINFAMYGFMFYYDRTLAEDVPSWTYLAVAIGMFLYQTLDAIDGKQARRTGSSSPLGQLFDHGCDTFSCSLVTLALVHALKLGLSLKAKIIIGSLWLPFFLGQLLEYHCGLVRTHVGNMGVTEGQLAQIAVLTGASFLGADFFSTKINDLVPAAVGVFPDCFIFEHIVFGVTVFNSLLFAAILLWEMISQKKTLSGKLYALWGLNPIILIITSLFLLDENDEFIKQNASIVIFGISMVFTIITTKVIISSMAHMHISSLQLEPFILYLHYLCYGENKKYQVYVIIGEIVVASLLYLRFVRV